jgi:pimeloyl-ACP methyl ester carboxylesterase
VDPQAVASVELMRRKWVLYPLAALLALIAVGVPFELASEARDRKTLIMRGRMVDIGGRRLHLRCTGSGSPTVVLLPGFAEFSSAWGWIEPQVARGTQVCVYDIAGRAWSDPAPRPQNALDLADDLHALLQNGGVPRPVVLAGHSLGGLYALTYAKRYPDDVTGIVLLDSTSPQMFTRIAVYPRVYESYRRASALFPALSRIGIGRIAYRWSFTDLPQTEAAEALAFTATPRGAQSQRNEWLHAPDAMRHAASLQTLGTRPLIVVTAMRDALDGWPGVQKDLVRLSSNSVHRLAPNATHAALIGDRQQSMIAVRAIDDVVTALREGVSLQQ